MFFGTLILTSWIVTLHASAQSICENSGIPLTGSDGTASSCSCPPGFGGNTCSLPGCGDDIFYGTRRNLSQPLSSTTYSNLTASGCSCTNGWTGVGCNLCTSDSVCQNAFDISGATPSQRLGCNTEARVFASGMASCGIEHPTLQSAFPGQLNMTILRTLDGSKSPLPNTTSFGESGSLFFQIWYNGVEQAYCGAKECYVHTQASPLFTEWNCHQLSCTCRNGSNMCGGNENTSFTQAINELSGSLSLHCPPMPPLKSGQNVTSCGFKASQFVTVFGLPSPRLTNCVFGECVARDTISNGASRDATFDARAGNDVRGRVLSLEGVAWSVLIGSLGMILV